MSTTKITIQAIVNADAKKVWNNYTDPKHIIHWNFADPAWHCPYAENDMIVGGNYKARMEAKDGSFGFDFEALYTEITVGEHFTYGLDDRSVTVLFKESGNHTEVIIIFDPENENPAELQKAGWQAILNNFKAYAEKKIIDDKDFNISFLVDQTAAEVFDAVNNVRGWWSEALVGKSEHLQDEFSYRHGSFHYSKHKLTEVIPNKKIVWLTLESNLTFVEHHKEWNGTCMIFEISEQGGKTKLNITHQGLVPSLQCFDGCSKGWTHYLENSLLPLITTGKGKPDS